MKGAGEYIVVMIDQLARAITPADYLAVHGALRDLLEFHDRAAGIVHTGHGWTPAETNRLEEIRQLAKCTNPPPTEAAKRLA